MLTRTFGSEGHRLRSRASALAPSRRVSFDTFFGERLTRSRGRFNFRERRLWPWISDSMIGRPS